MIPYGKIFKQAYEITRSNKFLWIFGLFLSLVTTFVFEEDSNVSVSPWILIAAVVIFLVIYFRCKASLIIAIKAVIDKKETSVTKAFSSSQTYLLQLMGIYFMIQVVIGILAGAIFIPIKAMYDSGNIYIAISFAAVGILIFIPFAVAAALVNVVAPMFMVIFNLSYQAAVKRSFELISEYWQVLVGIAILMFLPQLLILSASVPIVFFRELPYHMIGLTGIIVSSLVLLLAHAIVAVFQQTVWVLTFLELVRPQKIEDEIPVVAPEIAG
jgi:hypothetical protein